MSGCIVGWAHSKFGKHEGRDIESLIVEVAQRGARRCRRRARPTSTTIYLGTMNGGFVRQEFPASLVLQADPALRFKPATRVENACATGSAAIHQGLNAIAAGQGAARAGRRRREDDRARPARRSATSCSAPPTSQGGGRDRGRLRRHLRQDRRRAISSAMATSPTRWPRSPPRTTRTAPPTPGADAEGLRLRVLPHCLGQEPVRRRPAEAHRLLAGVRRRRRRGAGRRRRRRSA